MTQTKVTRPCPKCKTTDYLIVDLDTLDGWIVRCSEEELGCGYEGHPADTIRKAIDAWGSKQELRK